LTLLNIARRKCGIQVHSFSDGADPREKTMIKDIVVNLTVGSNRRNVTDYAVSAAETVGAHLAGVAFAYEPVIPGTVMGGIPTSLIEAQREESVKAAQSAVDYFDKAANAAGLSAESRMIDASMAGAAEMFGRLARRFDLSIVGQAEPDKLAAEELTVEGALFDSGRPTLVVPYIQRGGLKLGRVLLAWDGSRTAARAIGDAIPLLSRSRTVELVIVSGEPGKVDEVPGADMGQHLARHGLKINVKRVPLGDIDVRDVILSYAADSGADLLVMGGYGHSRLREFILGGVTRGILESMTVPVLMSH
jgi:nucleotide-binding universal stress UspA family protein